MNKPLRFLALIFCVPLAGFGATEGIRACFNASLRSALRERYPAVAAAAADVAIDRLCEKEIPETETFCATNDNLKRLRLLAIGSGAGGLCLLGGIWWLGYRARDNRTRLVRMFRRGLYLTGSGLVIWGMLNAGIALGVIYYGELILFGQAHLYLIGVIGATALGGTLVLARNAFGLIRRAEASVIGKVVSRHAAPALWRLIEANTRRLETRPPDNLILGLDPDFFVTEIAVRYPGGRCVGRSLYCSLPLLHILSIPELEGVIGHELGHYRGSDTVFSQEFFPIYRGTLNAIRTLQRQRGVSRVLLLPAIAVLNYFFENFTIAEGRISRERELAADQAGVAASNTQVYAVALVKIHAFSNIWEHFCRAAALVMREGKVFVNASCTYVEMIRERATPDGLRGVLGKSLGHPTDSHPALQTRLEALGVALDDLAADIVRVSPTAPAIELVNQAPALEEELSGIYQAILARRAGKGLPPSLSGWSSSMVP